jgi:PPOX class probable F420-dependent enzyme
VRLDGATARQRFVEARVAHLATVTPEIAPHVVPICFVVIGDTIYSAVDDKPKTTPALRRLANVDAHAATAVLVDDYDDDWSRLWWARADGRGRVVDDDDERDAAIAALRAKYAQYRDHRLSEAVLAVDVSSWSGWAASGTRPAQ